VQFHSLDIVACWGTDRVSRLISAGTSSLLGRPRWSPSHVAILARLNPYLPAKMAWFESTTLCPHECLLQQRVTSGMQVHWPEERIRDYCSQGGRVELYRLSPCWQLCTSEEKLLSRILTDHMVLRGVHYDMAGAILSGTRIMSRVGLLPAAAKEHVFCSAVAYFCGARFGRLPVNNPAAWNPGRFLRYALWTGVWRHERRLSIDDLPRLRLHDPST
jgi:hypothetical protein